MSSQTDRRTFLKRCAMAAATAAMTGGNGLTFSPLPVLGQVRTDDNGVKWDKAPCRFCGTGCHVQVGVKEGRVVAIAGHFGRGEVVGCHGPDGREVARGLVNYGAQEAARIMRRPSHEIEAVLGYVDEPELIHRDNLVLLG